MTQPTLTLGELVAQPSRVDELAPEQARALLVAIACLQPLLIARAIASGASAAPVEPEDRWLTAVEVAARTGFTAPYVLELCRRGVLASMRQGKYVRIPESGLRSWSAAQAHPLDKAGSVTLPSAHDAQRGAPRPQGVRPVAIKIRRAARRAPGDGQEMGDGRAGVAHHQ
jgi:excisionase family DNA binding protein